MLAVEEYEELQVNLELEKDLRKKAESFAQEVGMLLRTGNLANPLWAKQIEFCQIRRAIDSSVPTMAG